MFFQQYYLNCLSQASYLVGDETTGRAVVVDPRRDISHFLTDARAHGLNIEGIINTHFHADFVAGHLEMAHETGAWIGYGRRATADYDFHPLAHGQHISLGTVDIEILETPGHTWESITLLVRDTADDEPAIALTGDTLFVGDVGRPDLAVSVGACKDELARALYHSLHDVLLQLPDETLVYPAHGAGSACGKNISTELHSTIGTQRSLNPSVQPMSEDAFVELITTGQPAIPGYFALDAVLNRQDRALLRNGDDIPRLSAEQVDQAIADGAVVLDARSPEEFAPQHIQASINVGLDGRFAETGGMVLGEQDRTVIITPPGRGPEAAMRLGRVGLDRVIGYVENAEQLFTELPDRTTSSTRVTADEFDTKRSHHGATVLDVRNPGERELGAIPGSRHIPLAELARRHDELGTNGEIMVHCAGGWRSSVGASLLRQLGHSPVSDLLGGYEAWQHHVSEPAS